MNLNSKEGIQKMFSETFLQKDQNEEIVHSEKMIMYRFLSEVERLADERGMNKKKLAASVGKSPSYITQLFRGNKIINLEMIAKFQNVFNVVFCITAESQEISSYNKDNKEIVDFLRKYNKPEEGFWTFHNTSMKPSYSTKKNQKDFISNNNKLSLKTA